VEGIRPLGRLAFFDHQESLRSRIQELLKRATAEDSLRAAQEAAGARFTPGPATVYVVASLSGGTGSGAALDLAYLLRTILAEIKLEYQAIVGVLLTATSAHGCRSEIQNATALACLDELRHFSTPGLGFPGDAACRLPSFDRGPFDETYVVDLGDGLNDADYQNEAQKVAEYLFRCAVTGARGFFEACRRSPQSGGTNRAGAPAVRTFAVGLTDQHSPQDAAPEVRALCQAVVRAWCGVASDVGRIGNPSSKAGACSLAGAKRRRPVSRRGHAAGAAGASRVAGRRRALAGPGGGSSPRGAGQESRLPFPRQVGAGPPAVGRAEDRP
jgi:hypothetical protein